MAHDEYFGSLTDDLLSIDKDLYSSATQHDFLAQAGKATLPDSAVCKWLVQDKYYQLAYVNFIGGLLAKLDLSSCMPHSSSAEHGNGQDNLSWMTLNLLIDALTAIRQEINFYNKTADKYNLQLKPAPPTETTKEYIQLFAQAKDASILEGLVVLWATEHCYLSAWSYASEQANKAAESQPSAKSESGAIAALHQAFIPNWTSEQFRGVVKHLASVTDAWAARTKEKDQASCERLWRWVLELESKFWPEG